MYEEINISSMCLEAQLSAQYTRGNHQRRSWKKSERSHWPKPGKKGASMKRRLVIKRKAGWRSFRIHRSLASFERAMLWWGIKPWVDGRGEIDQVKGTRDLHCNLQHQSGEKVFQIGKEWWNRESVTLSSWLSRLACCCFRLLWPPELSNEK